MRIGVGRIRGDGALECRPRLDDSAAAQQQRSEIVVSRRISRIEPQGFPITRLGFGGAAERFERGAFVEHAARRCGLQRPDRSKCASARAG